MCFKKGDEVEANSCGLVAVAIDKNRSSQHALKWAIECLMVKGQTIILVHVRLKKSHCSSNSQSSQKMQPFDSEQDHIMNGFILPFRCFCTRKDIDCKVVILEDTDVAKALREYVTQSAIRNLVVGSPKKNGFLSRFKNPIEEIPGSILKGAPDFCNIYGITKGKISFTHVATRPIPSRKQILNHIVKVDPPDTNHNNVLSIKWPQNKTMESPVHFEAEAIISPFTRERPNQNNFPSYNDTMNKIQTPPMMSKYSNATTDISSLDQFHLDRRFLDLNSPRITKTSSTSLSFHGDDENGAMHEETEEAHGREGEKVRLNKHSRKDREDNYLTNMRIVKLLEDIRREGKVMNQRQIEMFEKSYIQKQEKLALKQDKLEMERSLEDERIMALNTNGMPLLQAEYIRCRQMKIVNKRT